MRPPLVLGLAAPLGLWRTERVWAPLLAGFRLGAAAPMAFGSALGAAATMAFDLALGAAELLAFGHGLGAATSFRASPHAGGAWSWFPIPPEFIRERGESQEKVCGWGGVGGGGG